MAKRVKSGQDKIESRAPAKLKAVESPERTVDQVQNTVLTSSDRSVRIVTGSYEHNLLCLELHLTGTTEVFNRVFHFTPHTQSIRALAQSRRYLVSGGNDEHIRIYDLQKRKELGTLIQHDGSITCLQLFDAKWLLSGAEDGKIFIWRLKDWQVLSELTGHKGAINDLSIHKSGKLALSVSEDRTLILWNLMTGRKSSVLKVGSPGPAIKVRWTVDGTHFILGYDRKLTIYSADSTKKPHKELPFKSPIFHLEVASLDGREYILTSHGDGKIVATDFKALISTENDDNESDKSFELIGHGTRVKHFHMYHSFLASVSSDGKIVVWDLETRDQVAVYSTGDRLNCVVLIPSDIEKMETAKRERIAEASDYESEVESEYESDYEAETKAPASKKQKTKAKSIVSVHMEKV